MSTGLVTFLALTMSTPILVMASNQEDLIEYRPGDLSIILSVPHGGYLEPAEFPTRINGCLLSDGETCFFNHTESCATDECKATTVTDSNTIELAEIMADKMEEILGGRPHIIICKLKRTKLDANRDVEEAAQGNALAEEAYYQYHDYIEQAKTQVGRGIVFDLHGQIHMQNSTEVGYLISKTDLNEENYNASASSVLTLSSESGLDGRTLMTGPDSFGAKLEEEGYHAVPSPRQPFPGEDTYYRGGYITRIHGSVAGGPVDAIQLETPSEVRNDGGPDVRQLFGEALGRAISSFYTRFYQ